MHTFHEVTASKPRLALTIMLMFAALAVGCLSLATDAPAASGGISAGGPSSSGKSGSGSKYAQIWNDVPTREKRWARTTSQCESGGDPNAIGGGGAYRGAFQFLKSTWRASPKSPGGDPVDYDYRTQAVVAIMLKKRDGAGHWPVCG